MRKSSRKWFTIIELLGAIVIISVALMSILVLLRVAVSYTNKTRQETIAINLARESIEWMYTRRNTNWLKRSGEKDKYWLSNNDIGASWFQNDSLYKIKNTTWISWNNINFIWVPNISLNWNNNCSFQWDVYVCNQSPQQINQSILWRNDLLLWSGDFVGWVSPDAAGKFYRAIRGIGLYKKDGNNPGGDLITCTDWNATYWVWTNCSDNSPKEYRFCSIVEYTKNFQGKVELCGGITNYEE